MSSSLDSHASRSRVPRWCRAGLGASANAFCTLDAVASAPLGAVDGLLTRLSMTAAGAVCVLSVRVGSAECDLRWDIVAAARRACRASGDAPRTPRARGVPEELLPRTDPALSGVTGLAAPRLLTSGSANESLPRLLARANPSCSDARASVAGVTSFDRARDRRSLMPCPGDAVAKAFWNADAPDDGDAPDCLLRLHILSIMREHDSCIATPQCSHMWFRYKTSPFCWHT